MVTAIFGCIFAVLGIFTVGAIFVPLAAVCTLLSLVVGISTGKGGIISMAIVSGCATFVAFIVSPSAWALLAALVTASQK